MWIGAGTNLFSALGNVPPSVATAPSSAEMRNRVRATCQPPRLPAAADRQTCAAKRVPAPATTSATCASTAASIPDSAAAYSKVNWAYCAASTVSNASKVTGSSGWQARRYSAQFHHRRTNSRSYRRVAMMCCATARLMAASLPGTGESQWSAWLAVLDSLVSTAITFAPRDRASMIRCACGLK